ncbi:TetR family transcriptional regulator [Microbacterium sp. YY-01]|uniref:TetR family transcriptional regulator n=1 Tax=Microbacterium sp. YY-01 TaxID=3421634 RepID=UPI003D1765C8
MTSGRNFAPQRHDRAAVVTAALTLLDEVGLADLSMRRLAATLHVQPSALYWHFTNKQELLGAIADRILEGVVPEAQAATPEDRVYTTAHSIRDALLAYRDGAELVLSSRALRHGAVRAHGALVTALGTDIDAANELAAALFEFILGHTTLVQQRMHAESYGAAAEAGTHDHSAPETTVFDTGIRAMTLGASSSRLSV